MDRESKSRGSDRVDDGHDDHDDDHATSEKQVKRKFRFVCCILFLLELGVVAKLPMLGSPSSAGQQCSGAADVVGFYEVAFLPLQQMGGVSDTDRVAGMICIKELRDPSRMHAAVCALQENLNSGRSFSNALSLVFRRMKPLDQETDKGTEEWLSRFYLCPKQFLRGTNPRRMGIWIDNQVALLRLAASAIVSLFTLVSSAKQMTTAVEAAICDATLAVTKLWLANDYSAMHIIRTLLYCHCVSAAIVLPLGQSWLGAETMSKRQPAKVALLAEYGGLDTESPAALVADLLRHAQQQVMPRAIALLQSLQWMDIGCFVCELLPPICYATGIGVDLSKPRPHVRKPTLSLSRLYKRLIRAVQALGAPGTLYAEAHPSLMSKEGYGDHTCGHYTKKLRYVYASALFLFYYIDAAFDWAALRAAQHIRRKDALGMECAAKRARLEQAPSKNSGSHSAPEGAPEVQDLIQHLNILNRARSKFFVLSFVRLFFELLEHHPDMPFPHFKARVRPLLRRCRRLELSLHRGDGMRCKKRCQHLFNYEITDAREFRAAFPDHPHRKTEDDSHFHSRVAGEPPPGKALPLHIPEPVRTLIEQPYTFVNGAIFYIRPAQPVTMILSPDIIYKVVDFQYEVYYKGVTVVRRDRTALREAVLPKFLRYDIFFPLDFDEEWEVFRASERVGYRHTPLQ
jgi:hypothetical protein